MSSTSSVGAPVVRGASGNKIEVTNLEKNFGGVRVFREVSFNVPAATITALIGPNGAGKTTLINITCGVFPASGGSIVKDGINLAGVTPQTALKHGIGRTFQDVRLFPTMTVLENVMVAFPDQPGDKPWELFSNKWRQVEEAQSQRRLGALDGSISLPTPTNGPKTSRSAIRTGRLGARDRDRRRYADARRNYHRSVDQPRTARARILAHAQKRGRPSC